MERVPRNTDPTLCYRFVRKPLTSMVTCRPMRAPPHRYCQFRLLRCPVERREQCFCLSFIKDSQKIVKAQIFTGIWSTAWLLLLVSLCSLITPKRKGISFQDRFKPEHLNDTVSEAGNNLKGMHIFCKSRIPPQQADNQ